MNFLRTLAILLLLFTSIGAILGGWSLMHDPTGADLKIPMTYLENSSFEDYFFPGLILFIVNGIFSIVTMVWTIFRWKKYYWIMVIQGVLLSKWIIIQMLVMQHVYFHQLIFGGIGIILILIGLFLRSKSN